MDAETKTTGGCPDLDYGTLTIAELQRWGEGGDKEALQELGLRCLDVHSEELSGFSDPRLQPLISFKQRVYSAVVRNPRKTKLRKAIREAQDLCDFDLSEVNKQ